MFDVFYFGPKPNLFAFERYAINLEDAAAQCRTGFYWYIYGGNDYTDFNFDYKPVPWEKDHIHVWPSQWQPDSGVYLAHRDTVSNNQWHFHNDQHVYRLPNKTNWNIPEEVHLDSVDFSWHPNPLDLPYIYHFGTDYQQSVGLTYTVPGATELKFAGPIPSKDSTHVLEVLDIFFIDRGNDTAQTRFERLQEKYNVQKVRYANSIMDTIKRCITRSNTNKFWVISSEYDYSDFNFEWHAQPWQSYMTHVFPSQHQKWSDTFLINKTEFNRHAQWAAGLEQFPNLNFVTDQIAHKPENLYNIYYVDHGNTTSRHQFEYLRTMHPDIVNTRFVTDYLATFKRIMATADTEYVWIINSVCDYSKFDFTWQPEPWQKEMIHVFPSDGQDRGDTFYIHVESFKQQMVELELLDWFNVINYCDDQRVPRFRTPVHYYNTDDLVTEIKNHKFDFPYVVFSNQEDLQCDTRPCLWSAKDRIAGVFTRSGAVCEVPRDIKTYLKTQVYDYPYLDRGTPFVDDELLDIIFVSNGEPKADDRYEHLQYSLFAGHNSPSFDKLSRISGINGQVAALKAAAAQSTTPWFFMVPGKLKVDSNFDWSWQPDYWQEPKHYIFYARNPMNGLEYGHMALIAYNKRLVESMREDELDSSLSQHHDVVPVLSGLAEFNTDPWTTWRTAFREVLKLKYYVDTEANIENEHRLDVWCNNNTGVYSNYATDAAQHALEYYQEINGDINEITLSRNWTWLRAKFDGKYS